MTNKFSTRALKYLFIMFFTKTSPVPAIHNVYRILSIFVMLLIGATYSPTAYGCCGISEIVEFKSSSVGSFYKNGYPGLESNAVPTFYRKALSKLFKNVPLITQEKMSPYC